MTDPKTVTVQERLQIGHDRLEERGERFHAETMALADDLLDRCQAVLTELLDARSHGDRNVAIARAENVLTQLNGGRNVG